MSEGCRDVRGDVGVPRMASAKLERWDDCGPGLGLIFKAGGGERPSDDTELLSDCSGEVVMGAGAPFFSCAGSAWSAMVMEGTFLRCGVLRERRLAVCGSWTRSLQAKVNVSSWMVGRRVEDSYQRGNSLLHGQGGVVFVWCSELLCPEEVNSPLGGGSCRAAGGLIRCMSSR